MKIPKLQPHPFKIGDEVIHRVFTEGETGKWEEGTVTDWENDNFKNSPLKENPCVVPMKFTRGKDRNADMYLACPYYGDNILK